MNDGLYSSKDGAWETPPEIYKAILAVEGKELFDLDPCCSIENIPAYSHYIEGIQNGLALPWQGLVFLNPPYGREIGHWISKAARESEQGASIWALVPGRTDTEWNQDYGIGAAAFGVFLRGRITFWKGGEPYRVPVLKNGQDTGRTTLGTCPFPPLILYYGPKARQRAERWQQLSPLPGVLMVCPDLNKL